MKISTSLFVPIAALVLTVAVPNLASSQEAEIPQAQDIYFATDSSDLTNDARDSLRHQAEVLRANPGIMVLVEGHTDDRGTEDYNLALGERRAVSVRDFLVENGLSVQRLRTISYGEMRPVCTESDESCWQRNRRAHFVYSR